MQTYSPSLARRLAASVSAKVQETFAVIDELTNVSPGEARELIHACFAEVRREVDLRPPYVLKTDCPEMEIEEQAIYAQEEITRLADELEHRAYSIGTIRAAEEALALRGTDMKSMAPVARLRLLDGFTRLLIEKQRLELARLNDPLADYQPLDPLFSESVSGQKTPTQQIEEFGPSVEACIAEYLACKKPIWAEKTVVARSKQLGYLKDFLGPNMPISSVSAADIRAYRNALTMLRSNRGRARQMTFKERLTENTGSQISNKSASIIFEPAKAFFRWAKEEEGILAENPAADVRWQPTTVNKSGFKRRPFNAEELAVLFGSPLFTGSKSQYRRLQPGDTVIQDARYWIPIIGFYTGMRLGEIVQLHISDAVLEADVPHFDLNENSGSGDPKHIKTAAGIRKVPIHPDVLSLGFAAFVEKRRKWDKPCKRIFSEITLGADGQASTQFSKFFARLMDHVGLTDPKLTFHSFRHGAEDAFRNANLQQYTIDSIMGHSDGKVSSEYGEGPSLSLKAQAVETMKLPVSLVPLLKYEGGQ
ncbi:site-specific integrase [Qipengyuania sp. YG27]|uniref:Site-specific integrase n=1 Tax=Qipengyuania mesophila TaxID=2867246 RepID=A0ABS7JVN2_9SPHN|nr:site-specific integrase [Qipengyuania mesophila]MBX7501709.1 site-specific integrase [Qipengyuania mesophila]